MAYQRETHRNCRSCGERFAKQYSREVYCCLRCAWEPRAAKGAPDDCWPWSAGTNNGYGALTYGGQVMRVHRLALEAKLGRDLEPGKQALHRCDNPPCCNPAHLFEGTASDNMKDKTAKGRGKSIPPCLKGEAHGRAKLTEADVLYMRANRHLGCAALGAQFGVGKDVASKAMNGTTWKHLPL